MRALALAEYDDVSAARTALYTLLATLLWKAPNAELLAALAAPVQGGGELGAARAALAQAAAATDAVAVEREHFDLLQGVAGGELFPYASY
ncbi:MAG: molecular chaperone, partial [Alphaproteobacteria bacterium]|nr:molecular chaperone [Alphaproteobacteria bacterium]